MNNRGMIPIVKFLLIALIAVGAYFGYKKGMEYYLKTQIFQAENDIANIVSGKEDKKDADVQEAIASVDADNQKIAADKKAIEIKKAQINQQIALEAGMFGQAAALFKKNTVAYKLMASAQATMSTYLGASKALSSLPIPFNFIEAALVIATGLKNVAEINKVKFSQGTILQGASHENGGIQMYSNSGDYFGEAEGGEAIINKNSTRMFRDELSRINVLGGGRSLNNSSGFYAEGGSLAEKEVMYQPVLVVQDVNDLNNLQTKIDVMQTF